MEEARPQGQEKQPYAIAMADDGPMVMAGLWAIWKPIGDEVQSCTILTTGTNKVMSNLHDRMPVILPITICRSGWARRRRRKKSCWQ